MKKYGVSVLSAAILLLSFVFCRFVFFEIHGMNSWPVVMLIAGGVIISISAAFKCRHIPLFASFGYPISFAAGAIFQYDYADSTGGMTLNSMWIIWTVVYLFIVCMGVVMEAIAQKKRNQSER